MRPAGFLLFGIVLPLVPFILFEIKNHFINTRAGWQFVFGGGSVDPRLLSPTKSLMDLLDRLISEALVVSWGLIYFVISLLAFFGLVVKRTFFGTKRLVGWSLFVFIFTLITAVMVIKGQVHLHYIGLLLPIFFIIIVGADYFWQKVKFLGLVNLLAVLLILFSFVKSNQKLLFKQNDNQQINRAKSIAAYISQRAEDKEIFITSLSGSPYAYTYRYFLYLDGFKTDSLQPSSVFAVCEGGNCGDPEGHALWEIAQFGVLKTVSAEQVGYGVWVYELKSAN